MPIEGPLSNSIIYLRATAGDLVWDGGESSAEVCVSSDAYHYKDIENMQECEKRRFRRNDTGGAQKYVINIQEGERDPLKAAIGCQDNISVSEESFVNCWVKEVSTYKQRQILECMNKGIDGAAFAICAAKGGMGKKEQEITDCTTSYAANRQTASFVTCVSEGALGRQEAALVNCAIKNQGSYASMAGCAVDGRLTDDQRALYGCVANNLNDYKAAGLCAAGSQLNPEQTRIAQCVMENATSYVQMGVCAAGRSLTPEQQAFAQCAVTTGGQPYAFVACVGTQLAVNELQKCSYLGVGGDGCFGKNNTAVKFVSNSWKDVTKGPGPSNDLVGRDGFVMTKLREMENDIKHGPGENHDLVGKKGWVCQNLFFGC